MTTITDRAAALLKSPEAVYFSFDEEREFQLQDALADLASETEADDQPPTAFLALAAPEEVHLESHATTPLLVASVQSGLRDWQVNRQTNLYLFVRNLATGTVQAARPLVDMRRNKHYLLSGKGEPPNALNATSWTTMVTLVDLRKKVETPLTPGRYSVTAVTHDLRSNTTRIRITGDAQAAEPEPPGVRQQTYVQSALDAAEPLADGVRLLQAADAGAALQVAAQIKSTAPETEADPPLWSFNILLLQLDQKPVIIPVTVPVQKLADQSGGSILKAAFRIDLTEAAPELSGDYQTYLDMGIGFQGPYPLTFKQ